MAKSGKISNSLLTLSSVAILVVYAAGFERTTPVAAKFVSQDSARRIAASQGVGRIEKPTAAISAVETLPGVRSAPMKRTVSAPPAVVDRPVVAAVKELSPAASPATPETVVTLAAESIK